LILVLEVVFIFSTMFLCCLAFTCLWKNEVFLSPAWSHKALYLILHSFSRCGVLSYNFESALSLVQNVCCKWYLNPFPLECLLATFCTFQFHLLYYGKRIWPIPWLLA
jgi:hypothetical protein